MSGEGEHRGGCTETKLFRECCLCLYSTWHNRVLVHGTPWHCCNADKGVDV